MSLVLVILKQRPEEDPGSYTHGREDWGRKQMPLLKGRVKSLGGRAKERACMPWAQAIGEVQDHSEEKRLACSALGGASASHLSCLEGVLSLLEGRKGSLPLFLSILYLRQSRGPDLTPASNTGGDSLM